MKRNKSDTASAPAGGAAQVAPKPLKLTKTKGLSDMRPVLPSGAPAQASLSAPPMMKASLIQISWARSLLCSLAWGTRTPPLPPRQMQLAMLLASRTLEAQRCDSGSSLAQGRTMAIVQRAAMRMGKPNCMREQQRCANTMLNLC